MEMGNSSNQTKKDQIEISGDQSTNRVKQYKINQPIKQTRNILEKKRRKTIENARKLPKQHDNHEKLERSTSTGNKSAKTVEKIGAACVALAGSPLCVVCLASVVPCS